MNEDLFKKAMKNVVPLKKKDALVHSKKYYQANLFKEKVYKKLEIFQPNDFFVAEEWIEPVEADYSIQYRQSIVLNNQFNQLKKNALAIEDSLDLHGLTFCQVRKHLALFFNSCIENQYKRVAIIHGKSYSSRNRQSTIKSYLYQALKRVNYILAFCSAPENFGGNGVLFLLLCPKNYRDLLEMKDD